MMTMDDAQGLYDASLQACRTARVVPVTVTGTGHTVYTAAKVPMAEYTLQRGRGRVGGLYYGAHAYDTAALFNRIAAQERGAGDA